MLWEDLFEGFFVLFLRRKKIPVFSLALVLVIRNITNALWNLETINVCNGTSNIYSTSKLKTEFSKPEKAKSFRNSHHLAITLVKL